MPKISGKTIAAGAVLLIGGLVLAGVLLKGEKPAPYRFATVGKGEMVLAIKATGTLRPEEIVDVGAQTAGQILALGKDAAGRPLDFGSKVEEGMILATIDETLAAADVASARAQLDQAKAARSTAAATVLQAKARLVAANNDWERARITGPQGAISKSAFDAFRSTFDVATAEVAVAEASVERANADLVQAQAALDRAQRNLGFCIIRSPVKGVVIDRKVSVGQTIVSSFTTPSLFLIAKDLSRMQVLVPVNEADIGRVREGMPVTFTVDTFPGREFSGKVVRTRLNATMTQNVVTYIVEVTTDNPDGILLPYLTANMRFETDRVADVLRVPAAALSWVPRKQAAEEEAVDHLKSAPKLWVLRDGKPEALDVTAGLTDGVTTVVSGKDITPGLRVIVGDVVETKDMEK